MKISRNFFTLSIDQNKNNFSTNKKKSTRSHWKKLIQFRLPEAYQLILFSRFVSKPPPSSSSSRELFNECGRTFHLFAAKKKKKKSPFPRPKKGPKVTTKRGKDTDEKKPGHRLKGPEGKLDQTLRAAAAKNGFPYFHPPTVISLRRGWVIKWWWRLANSNCGNWVCKWDIEPFAGETRAEYGRFFFIFKADWSNCLVFRLHEDIHKQNFYIAFFYLFEWFF